MADLDLPSRVRELRLDAAALAGVTLGMWAQLPAGQRRAVAAYIGGPRARTLVEAAHVAGVSLNTLKTQLRRARRGQPVVWAEVAAIRTAQLAERHAAAVRRDERHSTRWFRRRFRRAWGYWPRERRSRPSPWLFNSEGTG